ncbi:hypothetical protein [Tabrizicola sp.]|uniref:hypothetical protein n=1 Tax=Tabrizicola sp. TaxID=2005166 RepID=UPI0035B15D51
MDQARPSLKSAEMALTGPADHPMLDMPFHVEIAGRQYMGRGISLVRAGISGLIDPQSAGTERLALVVFRFRGFVVALSIEVRMQEVDAARGTAMLEFLDPLGDHLPQLRHLMNAHIAGDLVTLGDVLSISPPAGARPKTGQPQARRRWLRGLGGTAALLVLAAGLAGLVAVKVVQRVFTVTLATPAVAGLDGRTLAATATGQIDFLNPEAKQGEVAFAIRSNTGQALSVTMPCDCRVQLLGVEAGSTVFAGDPVLRVSDPDAGVVVTGSVPPDRLLDLAQAGSIELGFAGGREVTARLAPDGLGTAAPGEPVPFRLIPTEPLAEELVGQLAEVTLRRSLPGALQPLAAVINRSIPDAEADQP